MKNKRERIIFSLISLILLIITIVNNNVQAVQNISSYTSETIKPLLDQELNAFKSRGNTLEIEGKLEIDQRLIYIFVAKHNELALKYPRLTTKFKIVFSPHPLPDRYYTGLGVDASIHQYQAELKQIYNINTIFSDSKYTTAVTRNSFLTLAINNYIEAFFACDNQTDYQKILAEIMHHCPAERYNKDEVRIIAEHNPKKLLSRLIRNLNWNAFACLSPLENELEKWLNAKYGSEDGNFEAENYLEAEDD